MARSSYFGHLKKLIPENERLDVFTLNYDLLVENACHAAGIDFTTGFKKCWDPSLFQRDGPGINLYKLHGSLSWFVKRDQFHPAPLVEREPDGSSLPELVLGPGKKLQFDDPFVTLYSAFHKALGKAKACVTIGYSFRDDHINLPLQAASNRGTIIVDVRPPRNPNETRFSAYKRICAAAKTALESDSILDALSGLS